MAIHPRPRSVARQLVALAGLLGAATILVALLEHAFDIVNADVVYLLAVVAAAVGFGTAAAIGTAVASFLLYDFFFVHPLLTFSVASWTAVLDLCLLLFVGAIVGQLAAMQRNRAEAAERREREANALYTVSREFATSDPLEALSRLVDVLAPAAGMRSLWVGLGPAPDHERVVAATGPDGPALPAVHCLLRPVAMPDAAWITLHQPPRSREPSRLRGATAYRVVVEAEGQPCGSIWGVRDRDAPPPDPAATRVLSAAAEQLGGAIERRRLAERAASAEVARRSEALKTALLDSVSHDLRTPLASVRAAAGSLMDPDVAWSPDEQREIAATIDAEAERLNELVSNLLDMSRIEAGELIAHPEPFALADVVREVVARRRGRLDPRHVVVDLDPGLPPVLVDGLFLEQALANVLDNIARHTPPGTTVRISATEAPGSGLARLVVEDDGPGVPDDALPRLFEKFYRVTGLASGGRRGTGVGLSVARGLVRTMGGTVSAQRAESGGLAIVFGLPLDAGATPAAGGGRTGGTLEAGAEAEPVAR